MSLQELAAIRAALAATDREGQSFAEIRVLYEQLAPPVDPDDGTMVEAFEIGAMKAEFSVPRGADATAAILYFHGGGYCLGSLNTHRRLARSLAQAAGVAVLAIDYRLAPEAPFPAAVEDALAGYRHLIGRGIAPRRIAFAGDSAGGGLTMATMLAAKTENLPLPGAGFCISPWVDLANDLPSMALKAAEDPMISKRRLDAFTAGYLGPRDAGDPLASPLRGDLRGLPPILIQVGSAECLLDDAVHLAGNLGLAGVETRLDIWPEMIHVWHFFAPLLSEGRDAITVAGRWLGERLRT
ncbi:alpha/beta hydrolase [Zavarzinia compransoris]|uniref:Alpha/beta hydrolase n=1 Tax=Zavarzinia compransoris TaxID=1264899 RepID=A0A317EBI6_9PROT|nr:alpha/beta hydrolase [Zavarzinia compransoris]PWR23596.1 alpha/beta hydrolase [Zavarzinia compransoris]TDP47813.1 acetyl esterase/lipase [Zavarzinia compransoris]